MTTHQVLLMPRRTKSHTNKIAIPMGKHVLVPALTLSLALASSWVQAADAPVLVSSTGVFAAPTGEAMLYADDPKDWTRPKVVVPPTFPSGELKADKSGYVDIEVQVDEVGKVTSSRVVKSMPENKAFETAALEQVGLWLFHPKLSAQCTPIQSTSTTRVWFETRSNEGVVSVSGAASPSIPAARQVTMLNRHQTLSSIQYPQELRRVGAQADLYAVMTVDAATGSTRAVDVSWMQSNSKSSHTKTRFKNAAVDSLMNAKFAPVVGNNYQVCVPLSFRLTS